MMPAAAVVSHWFIRLRGAAMGIISAGSSLSAFLFYPLNAWLIASFGWHHALDIYGLIILLGIGPLGGLGGFIGPFLAYQLAFAISALAIIGSAVAVWVAGPRNAQAFRQPLTR